MIDKTIEDFLKKSDDAWEVAVSNRMKEFGLTISDVKILIPIEITTEQLLIDLKNNRVILKRYAKIENQLQYVIEEVNYQYQK